jgi:putative peptide zinc metalloprotease protein
VSTLGAGSVVTLRPLVVRYEAGEYVVGSLDNGEFVALPEVGRRAIELLTDDRTLGEAGQQLGREFGADVDLLDFVAQLRALGFVSSVDGRAVDLPGAFRPNLPRLRREHVVWLFRLPMRLLYAAVVLAAVVTVVSGRSDLSWLHFRTLFWLDRTSLVILANLVIVAAVAALHELAHLVAARSLGLPARINLGTRLYSLVAQTDVRCLWAVRPARRYRVYLAGMACDLFVLSLSVVGSAFLAPAREPLRAVSLLAVLAIANQFQLYMRTDLYLVAITLTRAKNLFQDSSVYLVDRIRRLRRRDRPDPLRDLSPREARVVRGYAAVMTIGSVLAIGLYLAYGLPTLVTLIARGVAAILSGQALGLVDGALTVATVAGAQVLFIVVLLRGRRERLRRLRERLG